MNTSADTSPYPPRRNYIVVTTESAHDTPTPTRSNAAVDSSATRSRTAATHVGNHREYDEGRESEGDGGDNDDGTTPNLSGGQQRHRNNSLIQYHASSVKDDRGHALRKLQTQYEQAQRELKSASIRSS